jgi:hypothetical protein
MASPGKGRIWISPEDPCLVLGEGTSFLEEFTPRMQVLLPKSVNSAVAEVVEVISDTELRVKKEFGGESGKGTARIRDKLDELKAEGINGLEYKKLPYVDQQDMYRHVYQCLKEGGSIGIFPEGITRFSSHCDFSKTEFRWKSRPYGPSTAQGRSFSYGSWSNGERSKSTSQDCSSRPFIFPCTPIPFTGCGGIWHGFGCPTRAR